MPEALWTPNEPNTSQMASFRQNMIAKYNLQSDVDIYQWSIDNLNIFWGEMLADLLNLTGILPVALQDENVFIDESIGKWFPDVKFNFLEMLLKRGKSSDIAVISISEESLEHCTSSADLKNATTSKCTFGELRSKVFIAAGSLQRRFDIKPNDVVAIYAGNVLEVLILALAAASLGAIVTTIPPDFGVDACIDRLEQTRPRLLLAPTSIYYNGRRHDHLNKVSSISQSLHLPIILLTSDASLISHHQLADGSIIWDQFLTGQPIDPESLCKFPFEHPLYILYSSGTTGKPKCIVHSAGGTLLQHWKEHKLHGDLSANSVFLQYTTIGWMMWHWMVSALALGSTIVLFEGSPLRPRPLILFELVDALGITHLGLSAKFLQHQQQLQSKNNYCFDSLKTVFSTGSPLSASNFNYVYSNLIDSSVQLASITGGTDIISLFAGGDPTRAVHAGEIQHACLGMAIDAVEGELVCRRPFPSMPIAFWNDSFGKNSKYYAAYFDRFEHLWHHGDFIQFNPHTDNGVIMLGRSDGVLNPAGVRFGSAELYAVLEDKTFSNRIKDALAVGVCKRHLSSDGQSEIVDPDERVFLFIQLVDSDDQLDAALEDEIRRHIRSSLSPRHVPFRIIQTMDIPYTLNGKKMEVAVKRILNRSLLLTNQIVLNDKDHAMANPQSLDFYRNLSISDI